MDGYFLSNYHQEALFILALKDEEYALNIDAIKNSHWGKETTAIDWHTQEYPLTISVMLSLDSVYLVILQVMVDYWRIVIMIVTVDWVQAFGTQRTLSTKSWTCLNGDRILSENVCNLDPLNLEYRKSGNF